MAELTDEQRMLLGTCTESYCSLCWKPGYARKLGMTHAGIPAPLGKGKVRIDMDELMSLSDIEAMEVRLTESTKAMIAPNVPLNPEYVNLFKTARAAHAYQQKAIDLLDENKNLDHSNKVLKEENEKLRERLDFRNSVPGTFCDSCSLWEQMAWERGREIEKFKAKLLAVMVAAQQLHEYILDNPTSDFDIPDEIYQSFTRALGDAE